MANNRPWAVPEGLGASVAYTGPGGVEGWYDTMPDGTAACSIEDNVVTAQLAPAMFTAPGVVNAAIVLLDGGGRQLSTFPFRLNVIAQAGADSVTNPYYNVSNLEQLNKLLTQIQAQLDELAASGGGGGLTITDDGAGNITILSGGASSIVDDGEGNITFV